MSKASDDKQMRAYLAALAEGHTPTAARKTAHASRMTVYRLRRDNKLFREEEAKYVPDLVAGTVKQRGYLDLLRHHVGNELRARILGGVSKGELAQWRTDPKFLENEQDELEGVVADAEEELTLLAIGRISRLKDPNLTLKILGKWRPDKYGDKPREIEHKFSGSITVQNTTEQIMAILGDDVELDALEQP